MSSDVATESTQPESTPLRPLFGTLPRAVTPDGELVAAHYGSPFAEERQLQLGKAFVDLSLFDVVSVTGADRVTLLHNLTTRDFNNLEPGASSEMMVLDPHGHIQFVAGTIDDGETTWLITDLGMGEGLVNFFESMKFMMRVEARVRSDLGVVGIMRASIAIPDEAAKLCAAIWEDPWPRTLPGGAHYGIADGDHVAKNSHRTFLIVERDNGKALAEALISSRMTPAGFLAWEAARVVDRRPRQATEVGERALPHELDWLRTAVHLDKGCYRGQETVAKLVNLGKPPRRLTYLYLEGPEGDLPSSGTEIQFKGRSAGVLTSVVRDGDEGPVALALLKRSVPTDAVLEIGEFVATQEEIVSASGKSSVSPDQRPGQGLSSRRLGGPPPTLGGTIG